MEKETLIKALVLGRCQITIGIRQARRMALFFDNEEQFSKTSPYALNLIIYCTKDISKNREGKLFGADATRSQKVMLYRKANLLIKDIAHAHRLTSGKSTEVAASKMYAKIQFVSVLDFLHETATLISNGLSNSGSSE
jgi:hypothetical protein